MLKVAPTLWRRATLPLCQPQLVIRRNARFTFRKPAWNKEKRIDVAILGAPNAGKSELLNCLLGKKIAAASRKRQTTRTQILGVYNKSNTQIAFHDTPGYISSQDARRNEVLKLRSITEDAVKDVDIVMVIVDAAKTLQDKDKDAFAEMAQIALDNSKQEMVLVLNKVDLVEHKPDLLDLTDDLIGLINYVKLGPKGADFAQYDTTTFMISAIENDGVEDIRNYLLRSAKPRPWLLPRGEGITDMSPEEIVEQMVLEALLDNVHDEIPYVAGIQCKSITDIGSNRMRVDVGILVDNSRQQRIVIGEKAHGVVTIRQHVADALSSYFNKTVLVYLWVDVRKKQDFIDAARDPNVIR